MPYFNSQTPAQFEAAAARSGLVYVPEVHHPIYPLAITKHLLSGGGFFYADKGSLDEVVKASRYFGKNDAFLFEHLVRVFDYYDFSSVDSEEMDTLWAIVPSTIMTWAAIFGPAAAWRMWNVVFSETLSGVEVQFPTPGEPVANLFISGDRYAHPGYDAAFPLYTLRTQHTLNARLDKNQFMMDAMLGPMVAADSFARIALQGATHFVTMRTAQTSNHRLALPGPGPVPPGRQLPGGGGGGVLGDFTIAGMIYRQRRDLLSQRAVAEAELALDNAYGETWFDMNEVKSWGEKWRQLQEEELGTVPHFPTIDGPGQLSTLSPAHLYGSERKLSQQHGGGATSHSGLDLPGFEGSPIYALYSGTVQSVKRGARKKDNKNGSGGNLIELRHDIPSAPGYTLSSVYAHQIDPDHLTDVHTARIKQALHWNDEELDAAIKRVKNLKRGDKVKRGDIIGFIGSTGNSSGPHLHLGTTIAERDHEGRSIRKQQIDPELVLRYGAVEAGRMTGFTVGVGESSLAPAVFVLGSIGNGRGNGIGRDLSARLQADLQRELDALATKRHAAELSAVVGAADDGVPPATPPSTPPSTPPPVPKKEDPTAQAKKVAAELETSPFMHPVVQGAVAAGLAAAQLPPALAAPLLVLFDRAWRRAKQASSTGEPQLSAVKTDVLASLGSIEGEATEKRKAAEFIASWAATSLPGA